MTPLIKPQGNAEGKAALQGFQFKLLIGLLTTALTVTAQAQLVADGATRILDGVVTNLASLTIGTNAPFTQLQLINNSRVTNNNSYVGLNAGSRSNTVVVNGIGTHWEHGQLYFGESSSWNKLIITNGGSLSGSSCYLGYNSGTSNQTAIVTGTNSLWLLTNLLASGKGENNTFIITNGGRISGGAAGLWANDTAVVTDGGSSWTNSSFTLNYHDVLVISNSGVMWTTGTGSIGGGSTAYNSSSATVTGPGSLWRQATLYVGLYSSTNQLLVTNGGTIMSGGASVGGSARSNNQVVVTGASSLWTNLATIYVGGHGVANQLAIRNGGRVFTRYCTIGEGEPLPFPPSPPLPPPLSNCAIVADAASELIVRDDLRVGAGGTRNYLTVTNGASVFANQLFIGNGSNSNSVTVANGNLIVTNTITVTCGALTLDSGFVKADRLVLPSSPNSKLIFNGGTLQTHSITGAVFLQIIGNGISPATFEMLGDGTNSFSPGGFVMVSSNAFIKGNGTIDGDVSLMAGATISPGASIGTIGVLGYLTLANGSTTVMELDASTGASDRINVSGGVLVYGGTLQVTNLAGTLTNGHIFTLFSSSLGYSGKFTNIIPATPGFGLRWNTNGLKIDGTLRVTSVFTPPPVINAPTFNGSNLSLSVSGGTAFDPCYLLATTNATLPFTSWTRVKTNLFNGSGSVTFTIPKSSDDQQRYFTVQLQ